MIFEREREIFGFVYWLPDDIWERQREKDFRFCILVTSGKQYTKPKVSLSLFLKHHLVTSMQNRESLSLYFSNIIWWPVSKRDFRFCILVTRWYLRKTERERLSVLYTGYQVMLERERETFDFAYWLPDDIWETKPKISLSLSNIIW
jgi:hypothetical protein